MDYFLRYPDIKQTKKHKSKKVFCAFSYILLYFDVVLVPYENSKI